MSVQTIGSVAEADGKTFVVRFPGFVSLPAVKGRSRVDSPEFTCFGHQWKLYLRPGGSALSDDGKVAVYLHHKSAGSIEVQVSFAVKKSKTKVAAYRCMGVKAYQPCGERHDNWGTADFSDRSTLIEALVDGALVIEVHMKQPRASALTAPFVPANPLRDTILKKFLDEESADVVFEVSGCPMTNGRKTRAKTSPTTFHAHRLILPDGGALAEACKSSNDLTPVPIAGTDPKIFRHLLFYLYGGKIDSDKLEEEAKEIIDAADKFGVVGLKLAAEAAFVSSTTITIDNVMDTLLYGYAKNLALVQEAVMDFVVENWEEATKKLSFDGVPGSFVADLLLATKRDENQCAHCRASSRVSALRKMLHEKGLDVDGSREVMIDRLMAGGAGGDAAAEEDDEEDDIYS